MSRKFCNNLLIARQKESVEERAILHIYSIYYKYDIYGVSKSQPSERWKRVEQILLIKGASGSIFVSTLLKRVVNHALFIYLLSLIALSPFLQLIQSIS